MNQFVVIDNVCYLLKCNDQCSYVFICDYLYNLYDLDILKQNHMVIIKSFNSLFDTVLKFIFLITYTSHEVSYTYEGLVE